jgi:hypothetical protein
MRVGARDPSGACAAGDGVLLLESIGTDPIVLTLRRVAVTGQVTDLRFHA